VPVPDQSPADLSSWLSGRLAHHLQLPVDQIDPGVPFAEYGIDSVQAVGIGVDIESELGVTLEASDMWEHPTVAALSAALAGKLAELSRS
jgi:acyl carrier protein